MRHIRNMDAPVGKRLERTPVRRQSLLASAVVMLVPLAAACGSSGSSGAASPSRTGGIVTTAPLVVTASPTASESGAASAIQGPWDGTWTSTSDGVNGTFHIDFAQSGIQLNGSIVITNTPCITAGTITGTLAGNRITFGAVQGAQTIVYTGTISG
ncbi:MAG: hypothetical protein M3P18_20995, partial [Actinomycetota bacterium]|nr:hypothetical protein [Actinomycetota bacterium]